MLRVLNAAQMQATDCYTIEQMQVPSMVLMEKAAEAMVAQILSDTLEDAEILVVCGSGNNGADGMAAARMLDVMLRCTWRDRRAILQKKLPNSGKLPEIMVCR